MKTKELQVKGKTCIIIDPNLQELSFKVHWIPFHVPDEAVKKLFEPMGKVTSVSREKWRRSGFEGIETTTRVVSLILKEGVSSEAIPHQVTLLGFNILVSVPGRPPMCLRCKKIGHLRKQCRSPWCRVCRSFGHLDEDCAQTYASMTRIPVNKERLENTMSPEEMEATGLQVTYTDQAPVTAPVAPLSLTTVVEDTPSPSASTYFARQNETGKDAANESNDTVATAAAIGTPVESTGEAPVVLEVSTGCDHPSKECSEEMELDKSTDQDGSTKRKIEQQAVCDTERHSPADSQPWIDVGSRKSKKTKGGLSRPPPGSPS